MSCSGSVTQDDEAAFPKGTSDRFSDFRRISGTHGPAVRSPRRPSADREEQAGITGRAPQKLATCSANPWSPSETDTVLMWLSMAISTKRRLANTDRTEHELWIRAGIGHRALIEVVHSAERMLPDAPYEHVLF